MIPDALPHGGICRHASSFFIGLRTRGLPLLSAGLVALLLGASGLADEPGKAQMLNRLEEAAERDRIRVEELDQRSQELKADILKHQVQLIGAARSAQDLEDELTGIETTLAQLAEQERIKTEALRLRKSQLSRTLAALQRIAVQPTEALLASPGSPIDTVRSAMLLRVALPAIEDRAETLRGELTELSRVRTSISAKTKDLKNAGSALQTERLRVGKLIEEMNRLQSTTNAERDAAAARAGRIAQQAHNLRELVKRIEQEQQERERLISEAKKQAEEAKQRQAELEREQQSAPTAEQQQAAAVDAQMAALGRPDNIRPFPSNPGTLILPARGDIVSNYSQVTSTSRTDASSARGLTIRTRPGGQIVAPYDGRIVYAGDFRQYGRILIIDHGERYHSLLAGLERIDAVVGQWVLAGEPVAAMADLQDGQPELYFELRRTGQPIDPLPWLASTNDKVQG